MRSPGQERRTRERESLLKFVAALDKYEIPSGLPEVRDHLSALFDADGIDYQLLAGATASALRSWPEFRDLLADADRFDAATIEIKMRSAEFIEALRGPLFRKLLRRTVVTDLAIERLVTLLRRLYLEWVEDRSRDIAEHL